MKIAIISDTHFGYAWGTGRQEDSFIQAKDAFEKALGQAELIILPGDIFDSRVPKQEVMEKAMRILGMALDAKNSGIKIVNSLNISQIPDYTTSGVPIVAIHGTHERRGSLMVNPVETLAAGGLLIHLHMGFVVFEKNGERVAVHGLSGVPETLAKESLVAWDPKPLEGAYNILIMHQSFKEMIYEAAAFLDYGDLPPGFDLYVNGHIHWNSLTEKNGKKILHPGSTIITQMKKGEAEQPKGFYFHDTATGALDFIPLGVQRKLYYKEIEVKDESPVHVIERANALLESIPPSKPRPLVKLKLKGSLRVGTSLDTKQITEGFKHKFILSLDDELTTEDFKKKIASLRELHKEKASIAEQGMDILKQNLEEAKYKGIPPEELLGTLEEGEADKALEIIFRERNKGSSS